MSDREWDDNQVPLAYLITFRTHGTWLHGDRRNSVDRHARNVFGADMIGLDPMFSSIMHGNMGTKQFLLNGPQRSVVEEAIRNVCTHRGYALWAVHVRTNHAHVVSYGAGGPKKLMSAFKSNSTRQLREQRLVDRDLRIWSRGGSGRYLWKDEQVETAIDYVINGQGDDLPNF